MKVPYRVTNLAEVMAVVNRDETLGFDVETIGLYGKIRLAQFYQADWPEVLIVDTPCAYTLSAFLSDCKTAMHNAHYEETCLQANTGTKTILAEKFDTFLAGRLGFPSKETFSLDDTLSYMLGYCPYVKQGINKSEMQKSDWTKPNLTEGQYQYAATDVYFMPALVDCLRDASTSFSYRLDILTLNYCLDFQNNGMPVQKSRFNVKYDEVKGNIKKWMAQCPINVNSYKQVREWLGVTESDDKALAYMELDEGREDRYKMCYFGSVGMPLHEAAGLIRKIRKERKKLSFMDKFEDTQVNGRIFGKFIPSARSGRLTSKDQNLQQLPRSLKCVFGVEPGSGRILMYSDYAQIELRHICALTACETMERLFREGKDLHTYTVEMIFGTLEQLLEEELRGCAPEKRVALEIAAKKKFKTWRQICKTCNFNLLYGGGVNVLIDILIKTADILLTEREGNGIRNKWRNLWREIYHWQQRGIAAWQKGRLWSTPLGRQYSAKMMTDQLNIANQGGAADVNKLAMHYLVPALREYNEEHGTDFFICNNIHDSFILEGPDEPEHYQPVAKLMAEKLQLAWFECSKALKIKDLPMPVNVICGYNWGDIETDDFEHPYTFELEPYAMLEAAQ